MTNLLQQAINCDDADRAARMVGSEASPCTKRPSLAQVRTPCERWRLGASPPTSPSCRSCCASHRPLSTHFRYDLNSGHFAALRSLTSWANALNRCAIVRQAACLKSTLTSQTCGPGPFSMADTGVVTKQLEIAGYRDIKFEQVDAKVFVGKDLDDAVGFQLAIGPAGEVYREAGKLAESRHNEIAAALRAQLTRRPTSLTG